MMKKNKLIVLLTLIIFASCNDYLNREPYDILGNDVVWSDEDLASGVLANLYSRMPVDEFNASGYHGDLSNAEFNMLITDEAMWSGDRNGLNGVRVLDPYYYSLWNYGYIRDLNLFIEKATQSNLLLKDELIAEARFLRALTYFEMVKRYGGVPILTKSYSYEPGQSIQELQIPRSTESDTYDFIAIELTEIANVLPANKGFRRATKWSALALKSRAMLYAASLAKYNNKMPNPIILPGKEVGIDASKSNEYYIASYEASKQIIEGGFYLNPDYFNVFNTKDVNEMIFAKDYLEPDIIHGFTYRNATPSMAETENNGSNITPYLELVEAYQNLDGTSGKIETTNPDGTPIYYAKIEDAFKNRDYRFYATVLYGGSNFKSRNVDILAGQKIWNSSTWSYDYKMGMSLGETDQLYRPVIGLDGPLNDKNVTNTGFYIKKFISTEPGAGLVTKQATNYWPIFRYSEILLNAAEAAFELNKPEALGYLNQVRQRAGFGENSLKQLTFEDIVHERRVELAFEGHRFFDLKRWRIAESTFIGQDFHGLYPYIIINEGSVNHLKYVLEKVKPARLFENKTFERKNYYTFIPTDAISNNPKLVLNPGQ